jgi:CheY-like chemotaxis protein
MTNSGKAARPRTLDAIPSVTRLPGTKLAGLRPPPVHILVIEDHDDTRDVLDILLRTEGYEVTLAVDGEDGLEKYRQRPADIVLVDIFMPRKNGIDTIRELTRGFPDSVCIAMSADGDPMRRNALEFAREAGARLTLRKPIEPWVLLRTLEGVVAGRRSLTGLTAAG